MAQYQNLFTAVQVAGPISEGIPLPKGNDPRIIKPFFLHLAGRLVMHRRNIIRNK